MKAFFSLLGSILEAIFLDGKREIFVHTPQECINVYSEKLVPCFLDEVFVSTPYTDVFVRTLTAFKYHGSKEYQSEFGELLLKTFKTLSLEGEICVGYIPFHFFSYFFRSYNHGKVLAQYVAQKCGVEVFHGVRKKRFTRHQVGKNKQERTQSLANVFSLKKSSVSFLEGKTIVLIDDIITTGTSANEVAKILKLHGAIKVYGIFLSRNL